MPRISTTSTSSPDLLFLLLSIKAVQDLPPIPACSDTWLEVGDQIDDIRVAYDAQSDSQDGEDVADTKKPQSPLEV